MKTIFEPKKIDIDISLLEEKEQEELMLFYQFLLFKSGTVTELKYKK